jgi:hypothetical protein
MNFIHISLTNMFRPAFRPSSFVDLGAGSGWSHVYQGSFVQNAVYPLCLHMLSLMGKMKLLTLFGRRTTGLDFWTKTLLLFFMAGVTGGINATELGLSVHSLTSSILLCLYNLG